MDRIRRSKTEDPVGMFIYDFDMSIDWNDDVRKARAAAVTALQERANRRIGRDGRRVSSFGVPNYHTIGGGHQGFISGRRESRQNHASQDRLSIHLDNDLPSNANDTRKENRREPHHKSSITGLSTHHKNQTKVYSSPNPSSGQNSGPTSPRGHQTMTRGSLQMFSQEHLSDGHSLRSDNKMNMRNKGSFSIDPPSRRMQSSHPSFNDNHGSMAHNAAFAGFTVSNEQTDMKPLQTDATSAGGRSHRHGSMLGSSLGTKSFRSISLHAQYTLTKYAFDTHYQYTLNTRYQHMLLRHQTNPPYYHFPLTPYQPTLSIPSINIGTLPSGITALRHTSMQIDGDGGAGLIDDQKSDSLFKNPKIRIPAYDTSIWDSDPDLMDTRHLITDSFRIQWDKGIQVGETNTLIPDSNSNPDPDPDPMGQRHPGDCVVGITL